MPPVPIVDFVFTAHAAWEIRRRGIDLGVIRSVLVAPEQQLTVRPGRVVLQSRMKLAAWRRTYLVRVFVDVDRRPAEVVTAYRTNRVSKYWKGEP